MSIEIDPRDVLEHLEYLGYTSITKEQLKDFIRGMLNWLVLYVIWLNYFEFTS